VKEILELRTGRLAHGYLIHSDCGHRLAWSLLTDQACCPGCGTRWAYADLLEAARGGYGYHWQVPAEIEE